MTFDSLLATTTLAQEKSTAPTDAAPAATATGTKVAPNADGPPPQQSMFNSPFIFILPIGGIALMMWFSGRKDKKKKDEMFSKLQKGAKVTTIGGARGKVTELTDTEVTVKFEDCSISFLRSAIQSVDEVPA